jgi:hypothetical protein
MFNAQWQSLSFLFSYFGIYIVISHLYNYILIFSDLDIIYEKQRLNYIPNHCLPTLIDAYKLSFPHLIKQYYQNDGLNSYLD